MLNDEQSLGMTSVYLESNWRRKLRDFRDWIFLNVQKGRPASGKQKDESNP